MGYDEFYKARDIVVDILEKDLVGPVEQDEVIQGFPTSYYVMGKLYPRRCAGGDSEQQELSLFENSEEPLDAPVSLSNQYEPSSMGFTFAVSGTPRLKVCVDYATYTELDDGKVEHDGREEKLRFQREGHEQQLVFDLDIGTTRTFIGSRAEIYVTVRKPSINGARAITVTLANRVDAVRSRLKNAAMTVFQPHVIVRLEGDGCFADIDWRRGISNDPELAELDLLYRNSGCYAQGHGCSVLWDLDGRPPSWISTKIIPQFAVRQMMPRPSGDSDVFKMSYLIDSSREAVVRSLEDFIREYDAWICGISERADVLEQRYKDPALRNVLKCRKTKERLSSAVVLLRDNDSVYKAFRLANKAMLLQWERSYKKSGQPFDRHEIAWYPFQLAFILQELESFANPRCHDRGIVDLLWFPTGGGKTEAYLGIAAFCIFLSRIRNGESTGVTVIMRYTLRLLTIQQFERASTMVAACEHIRKEEGLGGKEISIGLWVGGTLTPNKMDEAYESLVNLQNGVALDAGKANPVQVTVCPWCGARLGANDYAIDKKLRRMQITCPNTDCDYHEGSGLPLHVVDESIYTHLPTFIVATVDKFAQLPKKEETARLFGIGTKCQPPELIIQDELHLISGPLGTMVGLYESAIDRLSSKGGVGPKVIASTATVRNAEEQICSLYAEEHSQFPPQGIDMNDSFFAVEASWQEKPSRLYLGIMGVGTTQTTTLIRTFASLLFATRYLEAAGFSDEVVDAYWTIVGYFCTLRELGAALTSTVDRVQTQFAYLADTKLSKLYPGVSSKEQHNRVLELTSRKNNSEIVESIHALETCFSASNRFDAYSFVLATNMISVGVDVSRLGVMVVNSQPKSNSEYIQATSRVGRRNPGIVISVLNSSRSRDRSHYEQFQRFHNALYRSVESTSVTPYSDRARDRGLHTAFVLLCRYLVDGLAPNSAAAKFRRNLPGVEAIVNYIVDRVNIVDGRESPAVSVELEQIAEEWEERAILGNLVYWDDHNKKRSLLKPDLEEDRFRAMNSMRNVEPSSNVYILE